jgi:uncharacterized damage-inducible protein DinB
VGARIVNFALPDAVASLERTPGLLRAWLGELPAVWLDAREGEGTWSPREVLAHLIEGEHSDWIPRARRILDAGPDRPFAPFDRTAHLAGPPVPIETALDEFAALRRANLAQVAAWDLTEADLDRRGTHPEFGAVTLRQLLATWAVHDLTHVAQIARVMARRYGDDVGPWVAYLGVLNR